MTYFTVSYTGKVYEAQDWIVRIIGGGQVLSISASTSALAASAHDHPAYYSKIFSSYPADPASFTAPGGTAPGGN